MLRRERLAVHLVREQHLGAVGVDERQAALVVELDLALEAVIEAR